MFERSGGEREIEREREQTIARGGRSRGRCLSSCGRKQQRENKSHHHEYDKLNSQNLHGNKFKEKQLSPSLPSSL